MRNEGEHPDLVSLAPPTVRLVAWAALAAVGIATGFNAYYRAIESDEQRSDFIVFHMAARAMLDGADIYAVKHPRGWEIYYPPGMPAALSPLGLLPPGPAVVVWFVVNFAALVWGCSRLIRLCNELVGRNVAWIVILLVLANFGPILSGLLRGQISTLLTALMVEAFWQYRRGAPGWCGAIIGVAAGLKVYPALLLLPLFVRREWRGLFSFGAALAAMWIVLPILVMGPVAGWDTFSRYVSDILLPLLGDPRVASNAAFADINYFGRTNQSLFAFLGRWLCAGSLKANEPFAWAVADWPTATVRRISQGISLLLLAAMAWLAWRRDERTGLREAVVWSLPMLAANFISTIAWHHYYTVLIVTYALAGVIVLGLRDGGPGKWASWLVAVTSWVALAANWVYFVDSEELTGSYRLRQAGLLMIGSFALWIAMAVWCAASNWQFRRPPR